MATRRAAAGPMLDQLEPVVLTDPEIATIRHLQRIDRWTHAGFTAWGGAGFWIPCHMDQSETPDDLSVPVPVPPGVESFRVRALVSQRDKANPKRAEIVLTSLTTAATCKLSWQELTGGNTLDGAIKVSCDIPLQCRSGVSWSPAVDTVTVTFDTGTGTLWGLLFQPIHQDRAAS